MEPVSHEIMGAHYVRGGGVTADHTAGHVVAEGSTSRGDYLIRYPAVGDAPAMCAYINSLSQEKTYILFQGEEITLEAEEAYLESQLKKITRQTLVQLFAVAGGQIIGIAEVGMKDKVESHIGSFGISIAREWRGLGVGSTLMKATLAEAQMRLASLEIITLSVFSNNERATQMYHRFGFEEYGRLPGGVIHRGQHVDHIFMYKRADVKAS